MRGQAFLQALLGADCTRALSEAVSRSSGLEAAAAPRAMVAWLSAVGPSFAGALPGSESTVEFRKSSAGYGGHVVVSGTRFDFDDLPSLQMVAVLSVAAGLDFVHHDTLSSRDLVRLGKSLDAMVFTALRPRLGSHDYVRTFDIAKIEPPGPPAPPGVAAPPAAATNATPATKPKHATAKQSSAALTQVPGVTGKPKGSPASPTPAKPTLKIPRVATKTLKVEKHEAARPCPTCRGTMFTAGRFTGCICVHELAKSVDTRELANGYLLTFSASVEPEAYVALAATMRRR